MSAEVFKVRGGKHLSGEITPQGAKNEALQVISATLLSAEPIKITNIPDIIDVRRIIALLKGLGVKVARHSEESYTFQADDIDLDYLYSKTFTEDARKIRGSVMLVGPLLTRFGKAFLPKPGGDKIGRRRLDTHFIGFQKLGADFKYDDDKNVYYVESPRLRGKYILMEEIFR